MLIINSLNNQESGGRPDEGWIRPNQAIDLDVLGKRRVYSGQYLDQLTADHIAEVLQGERAGVLYEMLAIRQLGRESLERVRNG